MPGTCTRGDAIVTTDARAQGCVECLASGGRWVHLRRCPTCAHVGWRDGSPGRHATAHHRETGHPLLQSSEPGENWYRCYVDNVGFEVEGEATSPSHP